MKICFTYFSTILCGDAQSKEFDVLTTEGDPLHNSSEATVAEVKNLVRTPKDKVVTTEYNLRTKISLFYEILRREATMVGFVPQGHSQNYAIMSKWKR